MKKIRRRAAAAALILFFCILCTAQAGATKLVAITFDDGPNRTWTPQVVEALNQRGVKGTFFMVGSWVPTKEELVRQMAAQGPPDRKSHLGARQSHGYDPGGGARSGGEEPGSAGSCHRAGIVFGAHALRRSDKDGFGKYRVSLDFVESGPGRGQDRLRGENGEKGDQHHSGRGHHPAARQHAGQSGCRLPHHRYAAAQGI